MEHTSKPTGRPSDYYVIGLLLTGAIFWALTYFQKSFLALYQFIAVVMFGAAVYLLVRYRLTVFRLRIEGRNGGDTDIHSAMAEELDFVIEKMRGKSGVALARLSLDQLRRAAVVPYDDLKTEAAGASLFRYQPDMSPDEGVLLVFANEERDIAIFLDMPREMLAFLEKTANNNLTSPMD